VHPVKNTHTKKVQLNMVVSLTG